MKKRTLLCLGIAALSLTACKNGTSECTYQEFKKQVDETAKSELPEVKSLKFSGFIKEGDEKYEAKNLKYEEGVTDIADLTIKEISILTVVGLLSEAITSIPDDPETTYYVGNGFRAKDKDAELAWDENLNLTFAKGSYDSVEIDFKVSYSYVK
ncbi:MAG: hypothetical protein MJZ37_04630 [Bacilli bacterium]|nr:hypothetical protein [Bacilli bacterium]